MKMTSSTHLEFPGLQFAIRHGEVKDVPDDPEAAAFILASTSIQEVSEPERKTPRKDPSHPDRLCRGLRATRPPCHLTRTTRRGDCSRVEGFPHGKAFGLWGCSPWEATRPAPPARP